MKNSSIKVEHSTYDDRLPLINVLTISVMSFACINLFLMSEAMHSKR